MPTQRELDHQFRMLKWVQGTSIVRAFIRLLMIIAFVVMVVLSIRALAGHVTFADIRFKLLAEVYGNRWSAMIFLSLWGAGATTWAVGERLLRKRHIKRVSSEASQMQKWIDSNRRSSHLMTDGTTRPEDE